MARIFAGLAIGNYLVLLLTAGFGLFNPDPTPDRHILLAVFVLLLTALIQVVTFTYLTVTGKIIGQTVHLGGYDASALTVVKQLKKSFTHALGAMIAGMLAMAISGAMHWRTGQYGVWHLTMAGAFLVVAGMVLVREYALIVENTVTMEPAIAAYETWRRLPPDERRARPDQACAAAPVGGAGTGAKLEEIATDGGAGPLGD